MKKLSMILVAALVLILALGVGTAIAETSYTIPGNVHGGYTADTEACGRCHNTHSAGGENLIQNMLEGTENDIYRTCMYCHKYGVGSSYDVDKGAIAGQYASSGGGIAQVVSAEGATPTTEATTSKHDVDGPPDTKVWVPGYYNEFSYELTCAGCHDPHNTAGTARALRVTVMGKDISATPPTLDVTTVLGDEAITYQSGWNDFCGACHEDFYQTAAGSGDTPSGTTNLKRHRVGMDPAAYAGVEPSSWTTAALSQPDGLLPLQSSGGAQQVMCLTCHYAHGTKSTNTVTFNRSNGETSDSSTLLRLNNRGVCQACHSK